MNAELWHSIVNLIPLPWWVLMVLAPKAAITRRLTRNYAIFLIRRQFALPSGTPLLGEE